MRFFRRLRRRDLLGRFRAFGAPAAPRRFLDVGCGRGLLVDLFGEAGFAALGTQLSETAARAARARGADVRVGELRELALPAESFGIVVFYHVLEHVEAPLARLARGVAAAGAGRPPGGRGAELRAARFPAARPARPVRGLPAPPLLLRRRRRLRPLLAAAGFQIAGERYFSLEYSPVSDAAEPAQPAARPAQPAARRPAPQQRVGLAAALALDLAAPVAGDRAGAVRPAALARWAVGAGGQHLPDLCGEAGDCNVISTGKRPGRISGTTPRSSPANAGASPPSFLRMSWAPIAAIFGDRLLPALASADDPDPLGRRVARGAHRGEGRLLADGDRLLDLGGAAAVDALQVRARPFRRFGAFASGCRCCWPGWR